MSDFSGQFDGKTISVHVRSWHQDSKEWSRTFSLEKVYEALDKEDGSIFFICCDSDEVLRKIRLRYGSRTISYPARTFAGDKGSRIGMQDALIQLLLLSKNSRHIITPGSTYSEIAWWLGGCRASVGRIARHTKNSIPG